MPAIAIIGAQWGDEGKGKATDLLGSRVDHVVKFNGGNNAGHTVVIDMPDGTSEKYALHLLPSGILTRQLHPGHRQRRRHRPRRALRGARRAWSPAASTSAKLKVSASAHVIASYNRSLDKVTERFLGSRRLGTTGRGIGPTYADKMNRIGIRVQDLFDEKILRAKVEGALELKGQVLTKIYNRRAPDVDEIVEELLAHVERLRPDGLRHRPAAQPGPRPRRDRAARGRPGHPARRRPRHLPVRHVVARPPPAAPAPAPGIPPSRLDRVDRHRQGLHDPRRRGPVPDRAARRLRRAPAQGRRRVRHHHRPPAPLRLVRRRHRPLRRPRQRRHRLRAHQARRAHRPRAGPGLRGLRRRRRAPRRDAGQPERLPPRRRRSTSTSPAGGRTSPRPAPSRSCPPTPAPTSRPSRRCPGRGSRSSASARRGPPRSCGTSCSEPARRDRPAHRRWSSAPAGASTRWPAPWPTTPASPRCTAPPATPAPRRSRRCTRSTRCRRHRGGRPRRAPRRGPGGRRARGAAGRRGGRRRCASAGSRSSARRVPRRSSRAPRPSPRR